MSLYSEKLISAQTGKGNNLLMFSTTKDYMGILIDTTPHMENFNLKILAYVSMLIREVGFKSRS